MTRVLAALGIAILSSGCDSQSYASLIDLDVPGNLEAVERANPGHFAKIQRILAEVPQQPPAADFVESWIRVEFQARDIRYTDFVFTSLPPKKRLEFSLDKTSYVKVVTLTGWGSTARPLNPPPVK